MDIFTDELTLRDIVSLSDDELNDLLESAFDDKTLARGIEYAQDNHVQLIGPFNPQATELKAIVAGTRTKPYSVIAHVTRRGGFLAHCSCPVSYQCKHAAATFIAFLARYAIDRAPTLAPPAPEMSAARAEIHGWLSQYDTHSKQKSYSYGQSMVGYFLSSECETLGIPKISVARLKQSAAGKITRGARLPIAEIRYRYDLELTPIDQMICSGLAALKSTGSLSLAQTAAIVETLLLQMLGTGRCFFERAADPLRLGEPRVGQVEWEQDEDGTQRLTLVAEPILAVIASIVPLYIEPLSLTAGLLQTNLSPEAIYAVITAPPILPQEVAEVDRRLRQRPELQHVPAPKPPPPEREYTIAPTPVLQIESAQEGEADLGSGFVYAYLTLQYDGHALPLSQIHTSPPKNSLAPLRAKQDQVVRVYHRDPLREYEAVQTLYTAGFTHAYNAGTQISGRKFVISTMNAIVFIAEEIPRLQNEGWQISVAPELDRIILDADGEWNASLQEEHSQWFSFELGVEADGQTIPLLPILTSLLASVEGEDLTKALQPMTRNGKVYSTLPDGRLIALPLQRVIQLLSTLIELHGERDGNGIMLSFHQALSLCSAPIAQIQITNERLRQFAEHLRNSKGVLQIAAPKTLKAKLRPYQREGLAWMQFLAEHKLGGILADDMGLGKTIQTLAHLLLERDAGRLEQPALIIAPTSVLPNWLSEAKRFAPSLRILALHGPDRKNDYEHIDEADVVITTYPLLGRDEVYLERRWSSIILDEAQVIKNPAAKTAGIARKLSAEHKICLTGTPMENHLGELWSLFEFIMPGMLRDYSTFTRHFRTPIEKYQDAPRSAALMSRVQPFILRRTKELVAKDLPAKTESITSIEISGDQRDLYETVRVAMDKKVRDQIERRGLAQSRIVLLDALLKLRQVCCDPRLVKITAAKKIKQSAKLSVLMEMLDQLVEEGRKVLVFSQFTEMLDLIKIALKAKKYEFVEITGKTRDRTTPVERFQHGDVQIFLISLKAGGTGLNLTAADTVIHYDPWWNPAVERQATDRAHRIGQKKPVFVYKLVVTGSIEERIVALQARKGALASAILDGEKASSIAFSTEEINELFRPLPVQKAAKKAIRSAS